MLVGDERLDHLLAEDLRIIQSPSVFSFSLDAVLLARFSYIPYQKGGRIIDLCSGNGIIPLLISSRTKVPITGVEIQERLADMARRSIDYNNLTDQIEILQQDLREVVPILGKGKNGSVICNPPYFAMDSTHVKNENEHLRIARHEVHCTLRDTIQVSADLLKQGGKASFVHRPERLLEIIDIMREHGLEPKRIQFVHPRIEREANTILIEGTKGGKPGVKYLPPIITQTADGEYTAQVRELLYGKE
ncbi:tRNA1(Val) (adenine(37)-N6)-methyltransferase [Listeria grandensis]|uniref:tRNA1(Val) (adenine(37)-N6)-methyltransferase n=1 Tax=Listeria grandensis TaxID=1494963 RepID=UPI001624101C|nr:tRNA1(Val) (adenine(37)-N6)-methyltransferase [Listeria grandensis]MBC1473990.1 tRNA1(Val) (adenine(37)-N6)-methyltransferase [Listeria grandensis]